MEITKEVLLKYNMVSLDRYKEMFGDTLDTEKTFYQTFLIQTDHIPNKIIEAQILDEEIDNYTEILNYRKFARQEINRLESLVKEVSE